MPSVCGRARVHHLDHVRSSGDTREQHQSFRELVERAKVPCGLYFIDVDEEPSKRQLKFDAITAYPEPLLRHATFNIIRHYRNGIRSARMGVVVRR